MSCLITGGSGQLGIAVSQELDKLGITFNRWSSKDLDIRQSLVVFEAIKKLSPKLIINCAAWTDVDGAVAITASAHQLRVRKSKGRVRLFYWS
jgi:dTDP-4-dehydrorhamnose reductase